MIPIATKLIALDKGYQGLSPDVVRYILTQVKHLTVTWLEIFMCIVVTDQIRAVIVMGCVGWEIFCLLLEVTGYWLKWASTSVIKLIPVFFYLSSHFIVCLCPSSTLSYIYIYVCVCVCVYI